MRLPTTFRRKNAGWLLVIHAGYTNMRQAACLPAGPTAMVGLVGEVAWPSSAHHGFTVPAASSHQVRCYRSNIHPHFCTGFLSLSSSHCRLAFPAPSLQEPDYWLRRRAVPHGGHQGQGLIQVQPHADISLSLYVCSLSTDDGDHKAVVDVDGKKLGLMAQTTCSWRTCPS